MARSSVFLLVCLLGVLHTAYCLQEEDEGEDNIDNLEEDSNTVSALIEKANKNAGQDMDDLEIQDGDIAVARGLRNADPCTTNRCKWPRSPVGTVTIPVVISKKYTPQEREVIVKALYAFYKSTCIRFVPRYSVKDYISIEPRAGCWSFVGRKGGPQILSLDRKWCLRHHVVQHQMLHALGFNHEHSRSDRDEHIEILYKNLRWGYEHAFRRISTNNLGTPYDYDSVMQYGRYYYSRNGKPSMVPIPNANMAIGKATRLSYWDKVRVNRLYGCSSM